VELDRLINEPVDIRAERQLVARGEVVIVEDRLAIHLTEVVASNRAK
jgi:flagellar motor switch protein FliN/FliY